MTANEREERFYNLLSADQRNCAQRDSDRILYSSAFQRLAGITQVISPSEQRICHSRLTHSLKVGRLARRISEFLIAKYPSTKIKDIGDINPDVVEAAGFAHDLGHPPFGHAAEVALQECINSVVRGSESFEGNAQSFRVATKLAVRSTEFQGLDLTRATLNALLKYPWLWDGRKKDNKWGSYAEEEDEFEWAREPLTKKERFERTIEAEIMDMADDISYAVHDLDDFYRADLVPIYRLVWPMPKGAILTEEGRRFIKSVFKREPSKLPGNKADLERAFTRAIAASLVQDPYRGSRAERAALRAFTSALIKQFVQSSEIRFDKKPGQRLSMPYEHQNTIFMLQQLTWHYVILNPPLRTQQEGLKNLIRSLFKFYNDAAANDQEELMPIRGREMMDPLIKGMVRGSRNKNKFCARLAADIVSGMTEREALNCAHRILGISPGSVFDQLS